MKTAMVRISQVIEVTRTVRTETEITKLGRYIYLIIKMFSISQWSLKKLHQYVPKSTAF